MDAAAHKSVSGSLPWLKADVMHLWNTTVGKTCMPPKFRHLLNRGSKAPDFVVRCLQELSKKGGYPGMVFSKEDVHHKEQKNDEVVP